MTFIYTYLLFGVVIPGIIVSSLFLLAFFFGKRAFKKTRSVAAGIFPLLCWLAAFLLSLFYLSSGFEYPLSAVFQNNDDKYITTGYITDVTDSHNLPVYYDAESNEWSRGKFITVDGQQYYIPYGHFSSGTVVKLLWGNAERVVYECSVETSLSQEDFGTQLIQSTKQPVANSQYKEIGSSIATISFVIYVIYILLMYSASNTILRYLVKKDSKVTKKIIPNKIGLIFYAMVCVLTLGVPIGMALTGFKEPLVLGVCFSFFWILFKIKKMRVKLIVNDESIIIKEGNKTKHFSKKDVSRVYFTLSRLPYNKILVITFRNGYEVEFAQLDYWGLNDIHDRLNEH